jgi:hypothetical protein
MHRQTKTLAFPKPAKKEKYTQKKADELYSKIIRLERGTCQAKAYRKCSCGGRLQNAHIVGRGRSKLRYDDKNCLCLCAGHHRFFHSNPDLFWYEFLPAYFPDNLKYALANNQLLDKRLDYKSLILTLRDRLATLMVDKNVVEDNF